MIKIISSSSYDKLKQKLENYHKFLVSMGFKEKDIDNNVMNQNIEVESDIIEMMVKANIELKKQIYRIEQQKDQQNVRGH